MLIKSYEDLNYKNIVSYETIFVGQKYLIQSIKNTLKSIFGSALDPNKIYFNENEIGKIKNQQKIY